MPWGIQRLNVKKSRPNDNINFIKPLSGPDEAIAQDFLKRIAAQCLPVMREHHLYVMSLEEFPPNREFVGRNFNAGEVIQLVLKSPSSGRWLPFEYVQMVMMHELAHIKQMNHSKAFWAVRNGYATQMRGLWAKGYTGDGIWGRGKGLETGMWEKDTVREGEILPEHLCGGTYRSRGRKRGRKPQLSYQERKQRRIEKKFGVAGQSLGADEATKTQLEKGKKIKGKPRVAGSARGRDLRAAAALARFEQQKEVKEEEFVKEDDDDGETASDSDDVYEDVDPDTKDAVDIDGQTLKDKKGRGMIKICEDEEADDPEVKGELQELQDVFRGVKEEPIDLEEGVPTNIPMSTTTSKQSPAARERIASLAPKSTRVKREPGSRTESPLNSIPSAPLSAAQGPGQRITSPPGASFSRTRASAQPGSHGDIGKEETPTMACSTCSYANVTDAITCAMCANVLDPAVTPGNWRCDRATCKDTGYRNTADSGICGLCGARKVVQT
ncbi:WLM domain-containing protein [Emericellopsis atlantica]|uniref:WLM domain-containing protein n=1 Tax=Emericellopsis atlantica TaxID=2614577 RepID=A0A9P8CLV4_9HYPO|nr:WLM domain-containing protein [Emericellopsis atlantica]KAG9250006.1 WLM domain-containing protein [Emericellopsis atlantica]